MKKINGEKIRQILEENFMTITELAKLSDVSLVTAMRVINNANYPRLSTLKKIAKALNCNPQDLIIEVENDSKDSK